MKYWLVIIFSIACCKWATAQSTYFQQQVNYTIQVALNDVQHILQATATIEYTNNSNDTLSFIWFHIWPNAYSSDTTAFSNQLLQQRRTDFYFTADSNKGNINNLNFTVLNKQCIIEKHPQYADAIKVWLPQVLLPKQTITVETPFTVKLPFIFSRSGHINQHYQIAQWYPKPAVYDATGWHVMPYLEQGEFYNEFGNYTVHITLPSNYIVGATGALETEEEKKWWQLMAQLKDVEQANYKLFEQQRLTTKKKVINWKDGLPITSATTIKTITYKATNVHDFAWFAAKDFIVAMDTVLLKNKTVAIKSMYKPWQQPAWEKSIAYAKSALRFYSHTVGIYPYETLTIVSGNEALGSSGMEYPSITSITTQESGKLLDEVIAHEIGHNWFYGALANNERAYAWMDEGMNSYYENRYMQQQYGKQYKQIPNNPFQKKQPVNEELLFVKTIQQLKKWQPIQQHSTQYNNINYGLSVYTGGKLFMQQLEKLVGSNLFDSAMKSYYTTWQYKHVQPNDFKNHIATISKKNVDSAFNLLTANSIIQTTTNTKKIRPSFLFNIHNTDSIHYINYLPVAGFNGNDKLMLGLALHNYQLPLPKFKFFVAPMYAVGSKAFNFFGNTHYTIYNKKYWLQMAISGSIFSNRKFTTSTNTDLFLRVNKLVPSLKLTLFNTKKPTATNITTIGFKSFLIAEENLRFATLPGNIDVVTKQPVNRYINQLKVEWYNNRILNPYNINVMVEQASSFMKIGATANYRFNYYKGVGGVDVRFFAGKFIYLVEPTLLNRFATQRYHINLTGPSGNEDYTYSDYFINRNVFEGLGSQQIMQRDGFFKVQTNLLADEIGRTDNWLMALNISGDVPTKYNILNIFPIKIPLKYYVDIGTYAEAWNTEQNSTGRFLYSAGLQCSLLNNVINIYIPILNSNVFRNYNKSILGDNRFTKTITFSLNLQQMHINKLIPAIAF